MLALIREQKQHNPEVGAAVKAKQLQRIESAPGPGKMTKRECLPEKNAELSGENTF